MSKIKYKDEFDLLLPKRKPKTVKDLLQWHIKLFEDCLRYELKKQIIENSIKQINLMIRDTLPLLKEEGCQHGAKLKIIKLNDILSEYREELSKIKFIVKSFRLTNESLIGTFIQSNIPKEKLERWYNKKKNHNPNILHGDRGWMIEYFAAKKCWDEGKSAFLTFGTFLDPTGFDMLITPYKFNDKVNFKIDHKKEKTGSRTR